MNTPEISFVALNTFPVLAGTAVGEQMGGAQVQQVLLGRELRERGYKVSFITMDYGQGKESHVDGFRVQATFRPDEGMPVVRFIYPRMVKFLGALSQSTADVFYLRCADYLLAPIVLAARYFSKKVVFCGASDSDFELVDARMSRRQRAMYRWGLRRCDAVVVQNTVQHRLLEKNFGITGHLIHNGGESRPPSEETQRTSVLWVSTMRPLKQPALFVKLATEIPEQHFVMVGGPGSGHQGLYDSIISKALSVDNFTAKGGLPPDVVEREFDEAKVLVNTSTREGFPNTFLHAWARGIPVFTFIDPDQLIKRYGLGYVARDLKDMETGLRRFFCGELTFDFREIRGVFADNFTIQAAVDNYDALFGSLIGPTNAGSLISFPKGSHDEDCR
jgi:glycosyltransferase involved in cell wall biosynthesis